MQRMASPGYKCVWSIILSFFVTYLLINYFLLIDILLSYSLLLGSRTSVPEAHQDSPQILGLVLCQIRLKTQRRQKNQPSIQALQHPEAEACPSKGQNTNTQTK